MYKTTSSAALMLNEQHIPLSVGDGTKIASQGKEIPFH